MYSLHSLLLISLLLIIFKCERKNKNKHIFWTTADTTCLLVNHVRHMTLLVQVTHQCIYAHICINAINIHVIFMMSVEFQWLCISQNLE